MSHQPRGLKPWGQPQTNQSDGTCLMYWQVDTWGWKWCPSGPGEASGNSVLVFPLVCVCVGSNQRRAGKCYETQQGKGAYCPPYCPLCSLPCPSTWSFLSESPACRAGREHKSQSLRPPPVPSHVARPLESFLLSGIFLLISLKPRRRKTKDSVM